MKTADELRLLASNALKEIEADLRGRRGLRQEWECIDENIRAEIIEVWLAAVLAACERAAEVVQ